MGWRGLLLRGPPGEFCGSPEQPMGCPELREVLLPTQAEIVCSETMHPIISARCTTQRAERTNPISAKFPFLPLRPASLPGSWRCHLHYQSTIALVMSCFPQLVLTRGNFMAPSILIFDSWWIFLCPCLPPKPPFLFFLHLLRASIWITVVYYCLLFALR